MKPRLVFLDAARSLAIVLMVYAHVSDSLVSKAAWSSHFATLYMYTRGTTAPLFLMVAGWAFAVASLPYIDDYRRFSKRLLGRVQRVLTLCMWGALLTLPWWHSKFPFGAPEDAWVAFGSLTPLHIVALSLALGQVVVFLTKSHRTAAYILLAMAVGTLVASPFVFSATMNWPFFLRGPFNATAYLAGFPLFPWSTFFFVGAGLGFLTRDKEWSPKQLAALFAGLSAAAFAVSFATVGHFSSTMGNAYAFVGPSLVLQRLGAASGMLAVAAVATLKVKSLPAPLIVSSRYSLTFYNAHMAIIWGTPLWIGLHHSVGATLSFAQSGVMTAVILVWMWLAVTVARKAKETWVPALVARARRLWVRAPVLPEVAPVAEAAELSN